MIKKKKKKFRCGVCECLCESCANVCARSSCAHVFASMYVKKREKDRTTRGMKNNKKVCERESI